jgi:N-acetylglucosamine kinase-like BadF-type ATPase
MKHHLLIADSGSTKTDWAIDGLHIKTQGINPFHQDEDTIRSILRDELLPNLPSPLSDIKSIQFYGSGVRPELQTKMQQLLQEAFPQATHIEAQSDLLGAARALCGQKEGIACILGTGANSCLFDGQQIVMNTPALGYILGDEGSGATLGKRFLNALYKGRLPQSLKTAFESELQLSMPQIIDRVYRQPQANRWLASLSEFISKHTNELTINELITSNFQEFITHNIKPYQRHDLPISAVGSIAFYYQEQLKQAAQEEGYSVGLILRSPIDALVQME